MSATYNLEPNPTAKVLLHTTTGDLELELFAKQTPVTSRNFLQLCLDGYYDNTVFHRLVRGFILQGGDPTGTGQGGESSYDGEPFTDEFHSRLKYTRRGLLGMANTGKKDDNGSQFFFTLAATPELQEKNTMFGRVAGETIYNLMKMAEAEIRDGSDERTEPEAKTAKKAKRKAGKNVLSFGDDVEDTASAPVAKKAKYNTKLVSAGAASEQERSIPIRKPSRKLPSTPPSPAPVPKAMPKSPPREKAPTPQREVSPGSEKRLKRRGCLFSGR
jgi:peptidyl-prolyl cis-trans isomerase SDCCAG10